MKNLLRFVSVFLFVCLFGTGCIKSTTPQPIAAKTYISVMHLAPTAPSIDVFFNTNKVSSNAFTPGAVSAAYNALDKGLFAITLKKAGTDSIVATIPSMPYDSLRFYTILVYNLFRNGPAEAVQIEDDFSRLNISKTLFRFFHASPDLGGVDLYIDNSKIQTNRRLADNAGQATLNNFEEGIIGFHSLQVKLTGTDSVVASRDNVEFLAGNAYTLYLKGLGGGTGNNALRLEILRAVN